jgi:sulfate permease, SulP family
MTPALAAWLPKSTPLLRGYDRDKFLSDLIVGVTVGLVASPMAFAIASEVSPQANLHCALRFDFSFYLVNRTESRIEENALS